MLTITPRRTPVQRALNRLGRGLGIMPFPVRFEGRLPQSGDRARVFEDIYGSNYWGSQESASGPGSELARTKEYRASLIELLRRRGIRSMFDAPCGDLNWMPSVLSEWSGAYQGGDISPKAIEAARQRCPHLKVRLFDICKDPFPDAELWHCRDTLFHLSFDDIWLALKNASKANFDYVLMTSNRSRYLKNLDIRSGDMRYLDLERAPFNFPRAIEYLRDYLSGEYPRFTGLWTRHQVIDVVRRGRAPA